MLKFYQLYDLDLGGKDKMLEFVQAIKNHKDVTYVRSSSWDYLGRLF